MNRAIERLRWQAYAWIHEDGRAIRTMSPEAFNIAVLTRNTIMRAMRKGL